MTKKPKSSQLLMFILRTVSSVGGYISIFYQNIHIYPPDHGKGENMERKAPWSVVLVLF